MADQDFNIKVVTTADTTGIRQTESALSALQQRAAKVGIYQALTERDAAARVGGAVEEQGSALGGRFAHGFERVAIHAAGIGLVYGIISALKETAEEITKISDLLNKQSELLVTNAKHMAEQSKFAQTDADILKIAQEGMKNIAEQHKVVEELQKKELTNWQKISDEIYKAGGRGNIKGPAEELLKEAQAQAVNNEQTARAAAMHAVRAAEQEKERVAALGFGDQIERLNGLIDHQQKLQQKHYIQGDIQGYLEAGQAVAQYKKQLEDVTKEQEKAIKGADAQTKAIISNQQAAAAARAAGDQKSAEMFEKSAEQFKSGATPDQIALARRITGEKPPTGAESAADNVARNLKAFQSLKGETGEGGTGLVNTGQGWIDIKSLLSEIKTATQGMRDDWK